MHADIVCVGFGPAAAGFLTELSRNLVKEDGTPALESSVAPGMPLQVVCYERADDLGYGVSGVVTRARAIRASFPDLDPAAIPTCAEVKREEILYLLDPVGASRRPAALKAADGLIRAIGRALPFADDALELPYIPPFLRKEPGLTFSLGQFTQWAGSQVMGTGLVQIWPATPVAGPLLESDRVAGVRLVDQGTDKNGRPDAGYLPGMDVRAKLTVVGDGPVGPVGRKLDERFGMPAGNHKREWAVGAKMVVELRAGAGLEPGTVLHTFGFPEPEIFGFLYTYPGNVASLGIFIPSTFANPVRTSYRYLQHWMRHPRLWRHLEGGTMRSWGAKSLQEDGAAGEPHLVGDGYARIGEGSGSTNMLSGSGVDEAWATGVQLAQAVVELAKEKKPFTKENLEASYVKRRRGSWVEAEGRAARNARAGFGAGVIPGLIGMALAGFSRGLLHVPGSPPYRRLRSVEEHYRGVIPAGEIARIRSECWGRGESLHAALMERAGWPRVPYDGKLLVTLQDALLMGGKVQAAAGYADHVVFVDRGACASCGNKICVEICSGEAIRPGEDGVPTFDREKCVHCGACHWNCSRPRPGDSELMNVDFRAGAGGLHSAEN